MNKEEIIILLEEDIRRLLFKKEDNIVCSKKEFINLTQKLYKKYYPYQNKIIVTPSLTQSLIETYYHGRLNDFYLIQTPLTLKLQNQIKLLFLLKEQIFDKQDKNIKYKFLTPDVKKSCFSVIIKAFYNFYL